MLDVDASSSELKTELKPGHEGSTETRTKYQRQKPYEIEENAKVVTKYEIQSVTIEEQGFSVFITCQSDAIVMILAVVQELNAIEHLLIDFDDYEDGNVSMSRLTLAISTRLLSDLGCVDSSEVDLSLAVKAVASAVMDEALHYVTASMTEFDCYVGHAQQALDELDSPLIKILALGMT